MSTFTIDDLCSLMEIRFSERQLRAITGPLEPSVIMAGAGSGKTSVMTARIVWLVATGSVAPHEVLGLTFTNKAAGEFRGRVREFLSRLDVPATDAPTVSTYHAFAQQLLLDDGTRIGLEPDLQLLSDVRREQLALRVVRHPAAHLASVSAVSSSVVGLTLALDDALAEEAIDIDDVRAHDEELIARMTGHKQQKAGLGIIEIARRRLEVLALVEQFRAEKLALPAIDYADMVRLALHLVRTRPEVSARLRAEHRVVLLDEYQDTSVAQRMLMQSAFGGGHAITAVGDALQAIYEWRGASAGNILDFPQHFPVHDGTTTRPARIHGLPTTQRFGPRIAELANDLTAELRMGMPGVEPLEAADPVRTGPGHLEVALLPDAAAEFAWLAARLREAHAETPWDSMAVLLRQWKHAPAILDALTEAGIPAHIVGKQALLAVPDIADLVAYLRVIDDPAANAAWVRILSGMRWRIGARDLAHLGNRAKALAAARPAADAEPAREHDWRHALTDSMRGSDAVDLVALGDAVADPGDAPLSAEARRRIARVHEEIRGLRRSAGLPIGDLVRLVVRRIGLDVEVDASDRAVERARRIALDGFLDLVAGFASLDRSQSLSAFLQWLRDGERLGREPQVEQPVARGAVSIMTIHAAKGLQWHVVALPTLAHGTFPSNRHDGEWPTRADAVPFSLLHATVDPELLEYPDDVPTATEATAFGAALRLRNLAEETRLAYVAVTRAERRLIASAARTYGERPVEPSRYLQAIRAAAESRDGIVHVWAEAPEDADAKSTPPPLPWPQRIDPAHAALLEAAAAPPIGEPLPLDADDAAIVEAWDEAIALRAAQRRGERTAVHDVPVPVSLTTTEAQRLVADPSAFVLDLVRPMPKAPAPAARRGSAFHAWVERQFAGQLVLGDDEGDDADDTPLAAMRAAFEASEWARRTPLAVEVPFVLAVGTHVLRGRIDAVYRDGDGLIVVDWKTNARASADPLQLVVYRRAAAARFDVPLERVRACFVYVAQGRTEWHAADDDLAAVLGSGVAQGRAEPVLDGSPGDGDA